MPKSTFLMVKSPFLMAKSPPLHQPPPRPARGLRPTEGRMEAPQMRPQQGRAAADQRITEGARDPRKMDGGDGYTMAMDDITMDII